MSDTPETDKHPLWHGEPAVHIDFARKLERERNEALEEARKWERLHDEDTDHLSFLQARDSMGPTETLNETAKRVQRERDEARALLAEMQAALKWAAQEARR